MKQYQIPGISGVDTRSIAKKLRDHGVMKAVICNTDCDVEAVINELKNHKLPHHHVARVSAQRSFQAMDHVLFCLILALNMVSCVN